MKNKIVTMEFVKRALRYKLVETIKEDKRCSQCFSKYLSFMTLLLWTSCCWCYMINLKKRLLMSTQCENSLILIKYFNIKQLNIAQYIIVQI